MTLRKTVTIPVCGEEARIDVDMRVIEIIERVYDANVDLVAAVILVDPMQVKLTQIAEVVMQWLTPSQLQDLDIKRKHIKESILTASHDDIRVIVGSIQAACLYVRRQINDEQFEALTRGEDLPDEEDEEDKKKSGTPSAEDGQQSSTES